MSALHPSQHAVKSRERVTKPSLLLRYLSPHENTSRAPNHQRIPSICTTQVRHDVIVRQCGQPDARAAPRNLDCSWAAATTQQPKSALPTRIDNP